MREYTIYVKLPTPADDDDEANVNRICDAMEAVGIDGDDWQFGDTTDLDEEDDEGEESDPLLVEHALGRHSNDFQPACGACQGQRPLGFLTDRD